MAARIQHHAPSLKADILGVVDEGIAVFRGIPFATAEKRWTHSQKKSWLESPYDATQYGPRCSQNVGQVLVTGGVNDPVPGDDELKCLNLNVVVPQEALANNSSLPVMVWIHGGGFNYGANSVARYRGQKLCLMSKADGNPVLIVQIQYRLGAFGYAASDDLATEQSGPKSLLGNYGLVDQMNALEWVRDHISDFGGNPADVTAFGVSAGSASIHHLILTGAPLFDRAILMSGSAPTIGPLPYELYEKAWQNFVKKTGIEASSPSERLQKLRALSPEEVLKSYSLAAMGSLGDGTLLSTSWQYQGKQPLNRCKSIIIGDTRVEAIIFDGLIKKISQPQFESTVHATVKDTEGFLKAFGFSHGMDPLAYRDAMRTWISVGLFQYPHVLVAATFPGKVYYYHFDEPSPYPGPTFGLPYHGQCALFVHQNGLDEYPEAARQTAETMGHIWTAFANDKEPWEEYREKGRYMRLGPEGKNSMQDWNSDDVRKFDWKPWVDKHFEELKLLTQVITCKL